MISVAPVRAAITYHASCFPTAPGPLRLRACRSSGCTCRESQLSASISLINSGKRAPYLLLPARPTRRGPNRSASSSSVLSSCVDGPDNRLLGPASQSSPIGIPGAPPGSRVPPQGLPSAEVVGRTAEVQRRQSWSGLPSEAVPATGPQDSRSTSFVGTRTVIDCSPTLDGREI